MSTAEKPDILFYQSLGELFYAIAASDNAVKAQEYEALMKMVTNHWNIFEDVKEYYDVAIGYQMEFVFKWFDYENMDAQDCFENFYNYAQKNAKQFTNERVELTLKTADAIASAFSSKNKSELIMLSKLQLLFNDIKLKK